MFIAPQDALSALVHNVTDETIKIPGRVIAARRWTLHLGGGSAKLEMEVWTEGSRLLRVDIADQIVTDRVINELMGKDPSARFRFIMERAEEAVELDV